MTGVIALRPGTDGAGERVVTVCCGDHRPTEDCLCCRECVTGLSTAELDPALRAVLAHDERERLAAVRFTMRRAFQLVTAAAVREHLADLDAATRAAVRALTIADFPLYQGRLA